MKSKVISAVLGAFAGGAALAGAGAGAAAAQPANLDREHIPGQLLVGFRPGLAASAADALLRGLGGRVLHTFHAGGAKLVEFAGPVPDEVLTARADALAASPTVRYVEVNQILRADQVPNDPSYPDLYGLHVIHAPAAWDVSTGSRQVVVGVIDTGIDYTHPDLKANMWTNPGETGLDANGKDKATNGIDDDQDGFVDDWRGWNFVANSNDAMDDYEHGTHVSGTIGARGNDGIGVVGVNWQVSLVGIKFLDSAGSGSLDNAVKAIEYATKLGVTLTSNSWGGGGASDTMLAAIKEANAKGILFVAAAGNDALDNGATPHYPGSYAVDNVISVAATDDKDALADFSDYGKTTVHLAAPGVNILSSVPGGKYAQLSGTSMATPHVSGAAALIKAAYPDATAAQIKARLLKSVDPLPGLTEKTITGGRLNVAAALAPNLLD